MAVPAEDLAAFLSEPVPEAAGAPATGRSARLSGRERDVLAALAAGHSTDQVGLVLAMSPHTVRTHLRNVMRKLEANTRAHAVAIAIGDGAIAPPVY